MRKHRLLVLLSIGTLASAFLLWPAQRRKKSPEDTTQTLEILPDPPNAVTAETARLVFHVAPMSRKGLLSQQVRDGLKWLLKNNKKAAVVKVRAFVAGSGDMRRVQSIVSEVFTDKRLQLPAVSVVQVGDLPMEGAQVVLESISVARKPVNPHGLAFVSGQGASSEDPILKVAPLAEESVGQIGTAIQSVGLTSKDVLRVTCFCSSLQDINDIRRTVTAEFPAAALNFVRLRREYTRGLVECEAVARLRAPGEKSLRFLNPEGLPKSPNYSQVALVGAPRVAFSGTQLAFRYQDSDVRLAFERLGKALEEVQASLADVVMASIYPLSGMITEKIRSLRFEFFDKTRPPASTMLLFEGLPSLDASFAVEVIAVLPEPRSVSGSGVHRQR